MAVRWTFLEMLAEESSSFAAFVMTAARRETRRAGAKVAGASATPVAVADARCAKVDLEAAEDAGSAEARAGLRAPEEERSATGARRAIGASVDAIVTDEWACPRAGTVWSSEDRPDTQFQRALRNGTG